MNGTVGSKSEEVQWDGTVLYGELQFESTRDYIQGESYCHLTYSTI